MKSTNRSVLNVIHSDTSLCMFGWFLFTYNDSILKYGKMSSCTEIEIIPSGSNKFFASTVTLKEETFAEETFASGKIREIFGRNFREFRELANFGFFARIIFREFML